MITKDLLDKCTVSGHRPITEHPVFVAKGSTCTRFACDLRVTFALLDRFLETASQFGLPSTLDLQPIRWTLSQQVAQAPLRLWPVIFQALALDSLAFGLGIPGSLRVSKATRRLSVGRVRFSHPSRAFAVTSSCYFLAGSFAFALTLWRHTKRFYSYGAGFPQRFVTLVLSDAYLE
jgi:hypothetical protein